MTNALPAQTPQHIAAIALSALLIAAAAPGVGIANAYFPWLVFIAFAPWLALLRGSSVFAAASSGFIMGMCYIVPGRWGTFAAGVQATGVIGVRQFAITLLFFACFALPFALFAALDVFVRRRRQLSAPQQCLIRAGLLTSLMCGLWTPFAYTPVSMLVATPALLQLAAFGGEPLLLALVLWGNTVFAALLSPAEKRDESVMPVLVPVLARRGLPSQDVPARSVIKSKLMLFAQLAITYTLVAAFGSWRVTQFDAAERADLGADPNISLGVRLAALPLQLDLPSSASHTLLTRDRPNANTSALELTRAVLRRTPQCELIVWPEVPLDINESKLACAQAQTMSNALNRPLLMQCFRHPSRDKNMHWLTAELMQPQQLTGQRQTNQWHGKSALVPFYEQPLFKSGKLLTGTAGDVFALDANRKIIPTLCYELHSRPQIQAGVQNGGNVVVHMASFSAFARHPIDVWDQAMAQIRAIEFGIPIVRAANRGPVGWIDANGRIRQISARLGKHAECLDIWLPNKAPQLTLYGRICGFAAYLPGLCAVFLLAFSWRTTSKFC